jgi:hypothetical protein
LLDFSPPFFARFSPFFWTQMSAAAIKEEMRSRTQDFQKFAIEFAFWTVLHEQSVAVISVDNDAAEVELEVALSTALLVGCNVDCVDIKISTGIGIVVSTSALRLTGSVSLGWPMWYLVPESTIIDIGCHE